MTVAEDLLRRHIETLVADNARWQTMLAERVRRNTVGAARRSS